MVTQSTAPKVSSTTRELLARALRAPTRLQAVQTLLDASGVAGKEILEDALYQGRKKILVELANLHDSGLGRLRHRWGTRFSRVADDEIFALRNELRRVWNADTPANEKQSILNKWTSWHPSGFASLRFQAWFPSVPLGRLLPHHENLHAQLVQGVLEHSGHFVHCANPSCLAPFFIARRRDQRVCEQGECTKHAQRQFSLEWWNREGSRRRAKRRRSPKSQSRLKVAKRHGHASRRAPNP